MEGYVEKSELVFTVCFLGTTIVGLMTVVGMMNDSIFALNLSCNPSPSICFAKEKLNQ